MSHSKLPEHNWGYLWIFLVCGFLFSLVFFFLPKSMLQLQQFPLLEALLISENTMCEDKWIFSSHRKHHALVHTHAERHGASVFNQGKKEVIKCLFSLNTAQSNSIFFYISLLALFRSEVLNRSWILKFNFLQVLVMRQCSREARSLPMRFYFVYELSQMKCGI